MTASTAPSDVPRSSTLNIVIVDDHSIFRSGLKADLADTVNIVGEAANVKDAIAVIHATVPDVVLLDVHLPLDDSAATARTELLGERSGGAAVLKGCATLMDETKFLALSVSDSAEDVVGVIRGGARGYITKGASGAEVLSAITTVAGGDAVFSPKLAGFVLDAFGTATGETAANQEELDRLSAREREVMRYIARGYTYREVASELFISIKTVETHVSAVLRKLQLSSRHELTAWALERRLL